MVEVRVVLASNGRITNWRVRCSACGSVGFCAHKHGAEKEAQAHSREVHAGEALIVSPRTSLSQVLGR